MKKLGFTLAEVLIALSIVGITAALTIPTTVQSHNKKSYAVSLASSVSNFENAMTTLIMKDNVDNLLYTEAWQKIKTGNAYVLNNTTRASTIRLFMANAFKQVKMEKYNLTQATYAQLSNPSGAKSVTSGSAVRFTSKNGVEYMVLVNNVSENAAIDEKTALRDGGNYINKAADVYIDINGEKKPNISGRDFFKFELGTDGHLYPYGSKDWAIYNNETYTSVQTECVNNRNGDYCAAYLAINGYKMDY